MIETTSFIAGNQASFECEKQSGHKKSDETAISFKKLRVHRQEMNGCKYILITKAKRIGDNLETRSCGTTCTHLSNLVIGCTGITLGVVTLVIAVGILNDMFDKSEMILEHYLIPPIIGITTATFVICSLLCLRKLTSIKTDIPVNNSFIFDAE